MKEKERFEYYLAQNQLYDKTNDELYCFGIEQDKTRLVDFLNLMNEDWWALYIRNKELREENQQLKKQLAEKEKEIESLRENSLSKRIFKEKLIPSHCMEQYEKYEQQIDKLTQDKISFCIERLEQIINLFEPYENEEKDTILCANNGISFLEYIDNQIEELKKEIK